MVGPMSEWKVISASEKGTSHIQSADPCQDYSHFEVSDEVGGEKFLLAIVADGAGSALKPIEGAEQVCNFVTECIKEWLVSNQGTPFSNEIVRSWVVATHEFIVGYAQKQEMQPRDFACTLLGIVIGKDTAAFFQIGDGAIVVADKSAYKVIFWPENGEYANMTYFVTDEEVLNHLQVLIDVAPDELAIFSDGLQRLALVYESKTAHTPFFVPIFKRLQNIEKSNLEGLQEELHQFLKHPRVNERTDDDKTLILATRLPVETTAL
jgi:Protein phosphatase 2C